ncbi:MAG: 16S rRNA (guanine(527)-N(7))-methyltransferase RsmG [Victivallaceae bacterium]|nr:16S rRNA (guanine(527)-N(7))-methyltransferase RsmG [Victivallaceae bacterium]
MAQIWDELGVLPDPDGFASQMQKLHKLLVCENEKYNLTRLTGAEDFAIKHVYDSLAAVRYFPELATEKLRLADIGCGAGFPSLVLAAAFPNLQVTAIDSTGKKVHFVALAAKELGLKNCSAVQGRSIELNRQARFQGAFDVVTARAVAPACKIVGEACRFPAQNGFFLLYKTPEQASEDLAELSANGDGQWQTTEAFALPGGAGMRLFLFQSRKCGSGQ